MRKSYHLIDTPNSPSKDFQRHAYQLPGNKDITVIHYLGNEDVASNFPHHNAKHSTSTYVRTCPSYVKTLKKKCEITRVNVVYKKEVAQPSCQPEHVRVCTTRTCNSYELFDTSNSVINVYPMMNYTIYMSWHTIFPGLFIRSTHFEISHVYVASRSCLTKQTRH